MKNYISTDSKEDETKAHIELLKARRPSGFPDRNPQLQVGTPIMLRNLSSGLVNGTRMIVRELLENVIKAEVMIGTSKRQRLYILRIPMVDKFSLISIFRGKVNPS